MKVGILSEQLRQEIPGGIGTYLKGLFAGLVALENPDLDLVALTSRAPKDDPLVGEGIDVAASRFGHRLQMALWDRGCTLPAIDLDVLHRSSLAGPTSNKSMPPCSVMVHDLGWREVPALTTSRGVRWHEAAFQKVVKSSAVVVTPSDSVAKAVEEAGISPERLRIIGEGSDHMPPANHEATTRLLEHSGITGRFFLTVSTLEPRKNLRRLIHAYSEARLAFSEPLPLLIVGPQGWGPTLEPADGVIFAGRQPDEILAGLYERASCFVYVPILEGFGLPPLEAMAHGAAVIVSTTTPSTQACEACWKVDATDQAAIREMLIKAELSGSLEDLRQQGRAFAGQHRWVDVAQAHLDSWKTLA